MENDCEFCAEFGTRVAGRFLSMYGDAVESRIVAASDRFVVVPTLGQLFEGSLLVLPKAHVESFARLDRDARREVHILLEEIVPRCAAHGFPIVFEHGATASTGGGCGIYHAHLHLVPLPAPVNLDTIFPEANETAVDLESALDKLQGAEEYLLLGDQRGMRIRNLSSDPGTFASQFFRRRLAERYALEAPWDWRDYTMIEPSVLKVIASFDADALQG